MKSSFNPSLLLLLSSVHPTTSREYTRRRLANDRKTAQTRNEADSSSDSKPSFYDLSPLSRSEKLQMIQTAISVNKLGDSIDWDEQRDKFRETVRHDLSGSRSASGEEVDESEKSFDASNLRNNQDTNQITKSSRRLQSASDIDGDVFDQYEYSSGNCPDPGSLGVPCAPTNLAQLCNKYDRDVGSFRACFEACGPAFCCIHDADRELNSKAPNCNTDENCAAYNYCYIAWWKLHDTIGPALFLRLEQDDAFYDIAGEEVVSDVTGDPVFEQILLHHFDDLNVIIEAGTVDNEFNADRIFLDPEYWDSDI